MILLHLHIPVKLILRIRFWLRKFVIKSELRPSRVSLNITVITKRLRFTINFIIECHWLADPEPFYEDCLYDVCASKNDKTVACPILASYATDCSRQGYIANWREAVPECGNYLFTFSFYYISKQFL